MLPWAHPSPPLKQHLYQFSRFAQLTAGCPYSLQRAAPFSLKIARLHAGISTPSNTWFPVSPESTSQMESWLVQQEYWFSRFCRALNRDRPTDRPRYSSVNSGLHLANAAMRPNNTRVHMHKTIWHIHKHSKNCLHRNTICLSTWKSWHQFNHSKHYY